MSFSLKGFQVPFFVEILRKNGICVICLFSLVDKVIYVCQKRFQKIEKRLSNLLNEVFIIFLVVLDHFLKGVVVFLYSSIFKRVKCAHGIAFILNCAKFVVIRVRAIYVKNREISHPTFLFELHEVIEVHIQRRAAKDYWCGTFGIVS